MNNKIKLSNIAEVRLGMAFKSAIQDKGDRGDCYLIQTKDLTLDGNIDSSKLARVIPEGNPERHYLMPGDIILRLRGPIFSAVVFNNSWALPVVVSNQTAVIRCSQNEVSPYYLQWYLNSSLGQRYFSDFSEGTNIAKVTAKVVSEMLLELPSLVQQKQIENIHKNWLAQKERHKRLIENGDVFFDQICTQIHVGIVNNEH